MLRNSRPRGLDHIRRTIATAAAHFAAGILAAIAVEAVEPDQKLQHGGRVMLKLLDEEHTALAADADLDLVAAEWDGLELAQESSKGAEPGVAEQFATPLPLVEELAEEAEPTGRHSEAVQARVSQAAGEVVHAEGVVEDAVHAGVDVEDTAAVESAAVVEEAVAAVIVSEPGDVDGAVGGAAVVAAAVAVAAAVVAVVGFASFGGVGGAVYAEYAAKAEDVGNAVHVVDAVAAEGEDEGGHPVQEFASETEHLAEHSAEDTIAAVLVAADAFPAEEQCPAEWATETVAEVAVEADRASPT
ncbi:hypothetical protein G7046_g1720 [Stylonectria norvegica]|nr:hypothetical protein G7046_g1720 [Stylonectria norvegica]